MNREIQYSPSFQQSQMCGAWLPRLLHGVVQVLGDLKLIRWAPSDQVHPVHSSLLTGQA